MMTNVFVHRLDQHGLWSQAEFLFSRVPVVGEFVSLPYPEWDPETGDGETRLYRVVQVDWHPWKNPKASEGADGTCAEDAEIWVSWFDDDSEVQPRTAHRQENERGDA